MIEEHQSALELGTSDYYRDVELYDHDFQSRRHDIAWYRQLAADVASVYQKSPHATQPIVELGCGSGRLLVPLCRDKHRVIGVDLSKEMLVRCQQRLVRVGEKVRERAQLVRADFRQLPLDVPPSERFRLILCPFHGMQHLYTRGDLERFLSEVRRLLHPDGLFAFDVVNPDPLWLAKSGDKRLSKTRFKHPVTGEPFLYSTSHDYDPESQVLFIRLFYEPDLERSRKLERDHGPQKQPSSPPRTIHLTQRQLYPAELEALLHYNGFSVWHRSGGFDGQSLSPVSAEQVICARVR